MLKHLARKNLRRSWFVMAALLLGAFSYQLKAPLVYALSLIQSQNLLPVVTVSAASYEGTAITPDGIVAAFGTLLATGSFVGTDADPNTPGVQLPTTLGGTTVEVNGQRAGLFFVSPMQINYLIPASTPTGQVSVKVTSGDGTISNGTMMVSLVAPAIFTANSDGKGVPAANLVRVKSDGTQIFEAVSQPDPIAAKLSPKPLSLGPEGEQVVLVLYTTGVRRAADPNGDGNLNENVHVVFAGTEITPNYVGPQPSLVGLDQINVLIPRSLIGRGRLSFSITSPGAPTSNPGEIEIASLPGAAPPQITGFDTAQALAGQLLMISGNGFGLNSAGNLVRIGSTEAEVMSASATQLSVVVPFGAETGAVTVRTSQGEGRSASALSLRTSISGVVETTSRQPMNGAQIRLIVGGNQTMTTGSNGVFILPDTQQGAALVEVDATTVAATPPWPKVMLKLVVIKDRDNRFPRPIAMQQSTGDPIPVGQPPQPPQFAAHLTGDLMHKLSSLVPSLIPSYFSPEGESLNPTNAAQAGSIVFEVPPGAAARFPNGATSGILFLTQLNNSRTPVSLPPGLFNSTIVQIAPFGVTLNPGGKLTFPNSDNFEADTTVKFYRFDQNRNSPTVGEFIEAGDAFVSADGQRIETAAGAITETSIFFAAIPRPTTTVIGRVFDSDRTPLRQALVRARGQEDFTDGNGGYILRNVPVNPGSDLLSVEASLVRPDGRVERAQRNHVPTKVNGVTLVPDIILPGRASNQPPVILSPQNITINALQTQDFLFTASDPDSGQPVTLNLSAPKFASLIQNPGTALRLSPGLIDVGNLTITLTATDNQGSSTAQQITVTVVNLPPTITTAGSITRQQGLGDFGTPIPIATVSDPETPAGSLTVTAINLPVGITLNNLTNSSGRVTANITAGCNAVIGNNPVTLTVSDNLLTSSTTLIVNVIAVAPPVITLQPVSQALCAGANVIFSVGAIGTNLTYQWRRNGVNLNNGTSVSGATSPTLTLRAINSIDAAAFDVAITSVCNTILSRAATLTVNTAPVVTTQPLNQFVNNGSIVTFTAAANGSPAPAVQWQYQLAADSLFTDIQGATSPTLSFTASPNSPGNYRAAFTNTCGTATSNAASLSVNLACAPPPSGLISWYRGEGNANDAVIGNNGTLQNGTTFASGKVGQAFSFDGVDDAVRIPASASLNVGAGNGLTLMAWISQPDLNARRPLFEWNTGSAATTHFWTGVNCTIQGGCRDVPGALYAVLVDTATGGAKIIQTGQVITANEFQLVALTYDKATGQAQLYRNGVVVATQNLGSFTPQTTADLYFGVRPNGSERYKGLLDEADVYNRALTQSEIQAIFNADGAGKCLPAGCGTPSFSIPSNFTVGSNPSSVAVGDFNGDGKPDLVAANPNSSDVSILLNTGTGSFGTAINYSIGINTRPTSIAVGDFNGDGKPDLVTTNGNSSDVSILLNNGTGSFGTAINYSVDTAISFSLTTASNLVAVGDFNGDGKPDLVTANQLGNNVSILLNTGTGSFGTAIKYNVGTFPTSVAVGDFNGDGKPDLVAANRNSNNVSILLNNGTGSFGTAINYSVGTQPYSVAVSDFNSDGKPDLEVANLSSNDVSILLNNGTGSFGTAIAYSVGTNPNSIAAGDFNGDGKPDLVTTNGNRNNVSALLGNGSGVFGPAVNFSVGSLPVSVVVGDFNGDGKPDLATANFGSNNVSVLINFCGLLTLSPPATALPDETDKTSTPADDQPDSSWLKFALHPWERMRLACCGLGNDYLNFKALITGDWHASRARSQDQRRSLQWSRYWPGQQITKAAKTEL